MKAKHIIPIYFGLIALYFAQGALYPSGSLISQGALLIISIFGFVYMIKCLLFKKQLTFIKLWLAFLVLILLSFLLTGDLSSSLHMSQLKNILFVFLGLFPTYYWSRKNVI